MKKAIAILFALSMMTAASGCGKTKSDSDSNALKPAAFDSTEDTTGQPDPLASTEAEESTEASSETETEASSEEISTQSQPEKPVEIDPLGGGEFTRDENGAIVFEGDISGKDDRLLMAAAQALFNSACKVYWDFHFDCPYTLDSNTYITNEYGWQYKLITNPGVSGLADVEADYYKVFSDKYPAGLDEYIEKDGAVYALAPARGGNIFYSASKITAVQYRGEDEIVFTVENYYDGTDLDGSAPFTETDTFTAVISPDGTWKAGKFKLPY